MPLIRVPGLEPSKNGTSFQALGMPGVGGTDVGPMGELVGVGGVMVAVGGGLGSEAVGVALAGAVVEVGLGVGWAVGEGVGVLVGDGPAQAETNRTARVTIRRLSVAGIVPPVCRLSRQKANRVRAGITSPDGGISKVWP